jgi:hypothetical protein
LRPEAALDQPEPLGTNWFDRKRKAHIGIVNRQIRRVDLPDVERLEVIADYVDEPTRFPHIAREVYDGLLGLS